MKTAFCAAWIAITACLTRQAGATELTITTENTPPSSMKLNGEVAGRETEKIREIMARTDTAYTLEILPWARAFAMAERQRDTCVYSTTRTPEREKLFKWVGPLEEVDWMLLGRADGKIRLRTLEDARELSIGTYNGDARDDYLRARGFHVQAAPNDAANPHKLLMGRIDLWAVSTPAGGLILTQWEWAGKLVPLLVFNNIKAYLACNPSVPDELVERMNGAVADMRRAGTMTRLEHKYDHWDAHPAP
jgi:polar amino acid transport system substrate-binding protein